MESVPFELWCSNKPVTAAGRCWFPAPSSNHGNIRLHVRGEVDDWGCIGGVYAELL